MSDKIGTSQHHLPRVLLRQWGLTPTPRTNVIAYSKTQRKEITPRGVGGYCSQDGFYDYSNGSETVDDEFSYMENSFGRTVTAVKNGRFSDIENDAWIDLIVFISQIYQRTNSQFMSAEFISDTIAGVTAENLGFDAALLVDHPPRKKASRDAHLDELRGSDKLSHPITEKFCDRLPTIYVADPHNEFILGDDPVQIRQGDHSKRRGLDDPENYIFMPITPQYGVSLITPGSKIEASLVNMKSGQLLQSSSSWVDEYNKTEIWQAQEHIFYTPKQRENFNRLAETHVELIERQGPRVVRAV